MGLSKEQIQNVESVLKTSLRNKFENYNPEPASMPFHTRLLGKDRLALYSFIHSINTNFGTTIFEPVALALAEKNFKSATAQVKVGSEISKAAHAEIQNIMNDLGAATMDPNKPEEVERIRKTASVGEMARVKLTKADIMLQSKDGQYFLFDIKTAKPNAGGFKEFKRTLLEWVAAILVNEPEAKISTCIAIPYNPYEPKPYSRWTIRGMLDLKHELKVAEAFWDFLGGEGAYEDLLGCFERVGIALSDEIDSYFERFKA